MNPSSPESFPGVSSVGRAPENHIEVPAQKVEKAEQPSYQEVKPTPAPSVAPAPTLPAPAPQPITPAQVSNANPIAAADEDLIEKEWVQKAKKIISDTKDDPYTKEHEISKLQADYIKKRYGKDIKTAGES